MCLLIMLTQTHPEFPLVVGANRDELLDRPASAMTVPRGRQPRIVGGRDELAGGTWLAVNEHGVVAGLTNRPVSGRDATKRSRGELPVLLASHRSAASAVEALVATVRPSDYNPAWMLAADRDAAFCVDVTGDRRATVEALPPGVYVLENRALGAPSPKVSRVRDLVRAIEQVPGDAITPALQRILRDHVVPEELLHVDEQPSRDVPSQVRAACVHTERYGTRWSAVITVARELHAYPTIRYVDGPPCQGEYADASFSWTMTFEDDSVGANRACP